MNQKKKQRIIDGTLLAILLIVGIISFFIAYSFGIIPLKWITYAAVVVVLLFLILLILSIKELPTWGNVLKRIAIILLTLCLGTAGYFLDKSSRTIKRISRASNTDKNTINREIETSEEMYIVVNSDSEATSISDLKDQNIGFQNGTDIENANFIKEHVKSEIEFKEVEMIDYTTLFYSLQEDAIQGLAISKTYYNMSIKNIPELKDTTKVLCTYTKKITTTSTKDITKNVFTIYLSGLDNVGSPDQQTRTDTNLILIVNPISNHINMVSLPRDGYMPNTALDNANDKLTHTGIYGIDASVETIEKFFNIPIDFYARVSFNSLIQIIDIMDGINVDVEIDFCEQDENRSFKKEDLICLKKGQQTLDGKQALAYARHRKTIGYDNAGRERAQQKIIKAMINKLLTPSALGYVNELLDQAHNYIITDMSESAITSFVASELEEMRPWTISTIPSDKGVYDSQYVASISSAEGPKDVYLFSKEEVQMLLNAYEGEDNQLKMNDYHFDLSNLYKDCPEINPDPNIVWDYMANTAH